MEKSFLTPPELAERWSGIVNTETLALWRSAGKGPLFTKIGHRVLYALTAVVAYEQAQERSTTKGAASDGQLALDLGSKS